MISNTSLPIEIVPLVSTGVWLVLVVVPEVSVPAPIVTEPPFSSGTSSVAPSAAQKSSTVLFHSRVYLPSVASAGTNTENAQALRVLPSASLLGYKSDSCSASAVNINRVPLLEFKDESKSLNT